MDNAKEMSIFSWAVSLRVAALTPSHWTGPGMGETRRIRDMPSRYDYEVPGTAAFDHLAKRSDVDAKRIAIFGYSFGGYYSSRIAAFEKRYAACIALSALHWDLAEWAGEDQAEKRQLPDHGGAIEFSVPLGGWAETAEEGIAIAKKFTLLYVAKNITCPFLVTHGANEQSCASRECPKAL